MNRSITSQLLVVMYHYVRNVVGTVLSRLPTLPVAKFEWQIERLKKEYDMVSLADVCRSLDGASELPPRACLLSFDDGLKEHFTTVYPILKRHKISGAFFPITNTFEGKVADAHKIHLLLVKLQVEEFVNRFHNFLIEFFPDKQKKYWINNKEKTDPRYRFDDILTANLKTTLHLLPPMMKSRFLTELFGEIVGDEADFARQFYLSVDEIREMSQGGMTLGSHAHTHQYMDELEPAEQYFELEQSKKTLEQIIEGPVKFYSHPFGRYNNTTIDLMKKLGYVIGLGTEVGVNTGEVNRYSLKRLDTNDI